MKNIFLFWLLVIGTFLLASTGLAQNIINWKATDAVGAGESQYGGTVLYSSTGQTLVGVSTGTGKALNSGFLFLRSVPSGAPSIIAQTSLAFGNVIIGQSSVQTLSVQNGGSASLDISSMTIAPADYSIISGGGPQTIPSGGSIVLQIRFIPASAGSRNGSLVINNNSPSDPAFTVSLIGTGVATSPAMQLSTVMLDFGSVQVGSNRRRSVTVANIGNAPLDISQVSLGGANVFEFSQSHTLPASIAAGNNDYIEIEFAPSSSGMKNAFIQINSNDPNNPTQTVQLVGTGTTTTQPRISVSQTTVDFGSTPPSTPVTKDLVITNSGSATLQLSNQTVSGQGFSIVTPAATSIAAGGNSAMTLRFNPASVGSYSGNVTIASNDPTSPSTNVALLGTCGSVTGPRIAFSKSVLDFGVVPVLTPHELDVDVRNIGTSDLIITQQLIAGTDAIDFSIVQAAASPISPSATSTIRIRHLPLTGGSKVALLRLQTNDPGLSIAEVVLISTITEVERLAEIPLGYALYQNYPNPFGIISHNGMPSTIIRFEIPKATDVELSLFDISGSTTMTLVKETLEMGSYQTIFDASRLPSGRYFYRLRTKDFVQVKSMVLLN